MLDSNPQARSISRREAIRRTAAAGAALMIPPQWSRTSPLRSDDMSCILIWLQGGMSHLDTFDLKPSAPAEIRGEFKAIATNVPGISISEHLPKLAKRQNLFSIVRGLDPENAMHGVAEAEMLTGRAFDPRTIYPSYGSLIASRLGHPFGLPSHIQVGDDLDRAFGAGTAGLLGPDWNPCYTSASRFEHAFADDRGESERYGRSQLGRRCFLARTLIERGSRFVTVTDTGWDHHASIFEGMKAQALPTLDVALSALLDDLARSGRLESTLVVVLTDFGRASRVNSQGGRDHSSEASVALFAGGGIQGGRVVGATDSFGEASAGDPFRREDIAATVYSRFGIAPKTLWKDRNGVERPVLERGSPIEGLL